MTESLPNSQNTSNIAASPQHEPVTPPHGYGTNDSRSITKQPLPHGAPPNQPENQHMPALAENRSVGGVDSQQQLQKLLNDKEINWYGLKLHTNQKPIPVLKKDTPLWWDTAAERENVIAVLEQWPNQKELGMLLYRLQGHYWQQDMSEKLAALVVSDYLRLLGKYPPRIDGAGGGRNAAGRNCAAHAENRAT
jgi:hypothetical protein